MPNPWRSIPAPSSKKDMNTVLVSGYKMPQGVHAEWLRFSNGMVGLSVCFPQYKGEIFKLPTFKTLKLAFCLRENDGNSCLQIALSDSSMEEIFLDLCLSVIDVIEKSTSSNLLNRALGHLEKWRKLLSSGGQLTKKAQKGLIGELLFLRDVAMADLDKRQAIQAWSGPAGSPRDFTIGQTFFEVKANKGAQDQTVIISSENQLAYSGEEQLYLCVIGINENPVHGDTLTDVVNTVRTEAKDDAVATYALESRLTAAGYSDSIDYSDSRWSHGSFDYYIVDLAFPRLTSSDIPSEVSEVSYRLDLSKLDGFKVNEAKLKEALRGQNV